MDTQTLGQQVVTFLVPFLPCLPDSPAMQDTLAHEVTAALQADPRLTAEIAALWRQVQGTGNVAAAGDRSVAIGGNVSGSTIITGDHNRVEREAE